MKRSRQGFTLVELLVVIAIIAVLASMILPALALAKSKARVVSCRNNQKQLAITWAIYQNDYNDSLAQNGVNGGSTPKDILWVYGGDHSNLTTFTNHAALVDPRLSLFAPYLKSKSIYKCPEDKSVMPPKIPRVRSYAMNAYVGVLRGASFPKEPGWAEFRKGIEIGRPSDIFLTMDVYPETFCMPQFRVYMSANTWFHVPSTLHHGGGVISFTDGHLESRRWKTLRFAANIKHDIRAGPNNPDLAWVKARTTYDVSGRRRLANAP